MSKENFEKALKFLFPSEGGYVNDKDDKGGATNMGVTQSTYNAFRKKKGLPYKDIKYITLTEAKELYYEEYWKFSGADAISDSNMAVVLFDTAVLHGPATAQIYYKQSGGDINKFLEIRKQSYDRIVANNPSQKKFYKGWNNRVNNLKNYIQEQKIETDTTAQMPNKIFKIGIEMNITADNNNNTTSPWSGIPPASPFPNQNNNNTTSPWSSIPPASPFPNSNNATPQNSNNTMMSEQTTGFAANINHPEHVFTPEEIGRMSTDEYLQNEPVILKQLEKGQIRNTAPRINYDNFTNPATGSKRIYTREDIDKMSSDEYLANEPEILAQMKVIGIPFKNDVPEHITTYSKQKSQKYYSDPTNGRWVTINGNHVFIED